MVLVLGHGVMAHEIEWSYVLIMAYEVEWSWVLVRGRWMEWSCVLVGVITRKRPASGFRDQRM